MKIALIGPGLSEIPPKGWGAVEEVIYQHYLGLTKLGHHVDIFNSTQFETIANTINNDDYDIVVLHYDEYIPIYTQLLKVPLLVTQHYAYCTHPDRWGGYYDKIFPYLAKADGIICLSPKIQNFLQNAKYPRFCRVMRNGANNNFQQTWCQFNKAICLGKIDRQDRKGQCRLLRSMPKDFKVQIDFVGPDENPDFRSLLQEHPNCQYLGAWTKADLYDRLPSYTCMILMSDGEAAPLVIPEGLLAGLSIVCSQSASANLDWSESFIQIFEDNDFSEKLYQTIENHTNILNHLHRNKILEYSKKFEWNTIIQEYEDLLKDYLKWRSCD